MAARKTVAVTTKNGGQIRCYLSVARKLADGRVVALAKQRNRPVGIAQWQGPASYPHWRIVTDAELLGI